MIPLGNRVFIRPEIEEKFGLIHRARMSREMPNKGVITALSAKAAESTGLKVGDRVVYDRHHQVMAEDEASTITWSDKILAVLT